MKVITLLISLSIALFSSCKYDRKVSDNHSSEKTIKIALIENNKYISYFSFGENGEKFSNTIKDKNLQISINTSKNNLIKTFKKEQFLSDLNEKDTFVITDAKIENTTNEQVKLLINICKPDSDYCFFYKLTWFIKNDQYHIKEIFVEEE